MSAGAWGGRAGSRVRSPARSRERGGRAGRGLETGGESAPAERARPGAAEPSGAGRRGCGRRDANRGWLVTRGAWEGDLEHPNHRRTHAPSLTHNASTHFSQNIRFKLRQLKKKEFQLLIWKREGWGEALCHGEKNHASSIFLVGSRIDPGGRRGFLQDLQLGHWWGQRWQPSPHLPINLWEMHPTSLSLNPFPVAPLPGILFKFLPTLCPPSQPDPSQMRGQEWRVVGNPSLPILHHLWPPGDPVACGRRREGGQSLLPWLKTERSCWEKKESEQDHLLIL